MLNVSKAQEAECVAWIAGYTFFQAGKQFVLREEVSMTLEKQAVMACSRSGRMILHMICMWIDHRFWWHLKGIGREFV